MQCDICFRLGGHKLPFLCPTDARNQLYESRIQNARVLLEKERLEQEISTLISLESIDQRAGSRSPETTASRHNSLITERDQAEDRTRQIIAHADKLRDKVEKARAQLAKKKASLSRRKSELASATNGVDARRHRQIEEAEKIIRMTRYKWNQTHTVTTTSRVFLCGEVAKLYGLKKVRRTGGREEYRIGGVGIVDLLSMNTATPAHISTSLSHVVHLLTLATHYLSIRLPAEVTLPHSDYPLPTIFPLSSSYKHSEIIFPGSTPGHSSSNSPTASRHTEAPNQPRPRPLFIKKPLPILSNEDPAAYGLFLEGVTLLAYDIAWVCKSQGVPVGDTSSFEDICNLGKNLYSLLLGSQSRSTPASRTPSAQSTPTKTNGRNEGDAEAEAVKRLSNYSLMGKYSHGTAHSFLGGAEGSEFVHSWKLLSPTKLVDQLKSKLISEVVNAEWEVLDQDAWQVDDELVDDAVVIGARKEGIRGLGLGMQSFMSMRTIADAVEMVSGGADTDKKTGRSGWTKLKPR